MCKVYLYSYKEKMNTYTHFAYTFDNNICITFVYLSVGNEINCELK